MINNIAKKTVGMASILFILLTACLTASPILAKPHDSQVQESPSNDAEVSAIPLSDIHRFATVIAQIKHFYIKPISYEELFNHAIQGMLLNLDPHSSFLDEKAMKELQTITTGHFSGIGIEIMPEQEYIRVISPIDGSPAAEAGVKAGDLIIRIDDKMVKQMTSAEAIQHIRGKKGSSVRLTILRKKSPKPIDLSIKRDTIKIETVKSRWLEDGFGYIRIAFFHTDTHADLVKAIQKLYQTLPKHHSIKGVVIDLRNNPGGLLTAAIQVADTFLSYPQNQYNNLIVYTKGKIPGADIQAKITNSTTLLKRIPLVILINEGSASASEIVAGALQAYHRAIIVGSRSFGKGSVQTVLPTTETTAIKLTTALYYTPSGRSIQALGIEPDINIPPLTLSEETIKAAVDDHHFPIVESNLAGHLDNTTLPKDSKEMKQTDTSLELAHKDFQLFQALNLLKGLHATHPS